MKRILMSLVKVLVFLMLFNTILAFGFFTWFSSTVLAPSFKDTGITFSDIFKGIDPAKYQKLSDMINSRASQLGNVAGEKFGQELLSMFKPSVNINQPTSPTTKIDPYKSQVDQLLKSKSKEGYKQGMQNLQDMNNEVKSVK